MRSRGADVRGIAQIVQQPRNGRARERASSDQEVTLHTTRLSGFCAILDQEVDMATRDNFSQSYAQARQKFLLAARNANARPEHFVMQDRRGPEGDELAIDIVRLGPTDPDSLLVLISGVHGVEGFAGSGCQVGYLTDRLYEALPKNCGVLLIHALNPYGFAWDRRANEDNVDLNRNFQDFSQPLPSSEAYEPLHAWLVPDDWDGESRKAADGALMQYIRDHGLAALQAAASGGQYTRPTGLFYGGTVETWSNRRIREIFQNQVPNTVRTFVVLDIHSGLGPMGYGEPIYLGGDDVGFERAKVWFGPDTTRPGAGASADVSGTLGEAIGAMHRNCETTCLALEFGTKPIMEVLTALRADHWLHAVPDRKTPLSGQIRRLTRDAFYVESSPWQAAVYGRAADLLLRASRNLAAK